MMNLTMRLMNMAPTAMAMVPKPAAIPPCWATEPTTAGIVMPPTVAIAMIAPMPDVLSVMAGSTVERTVG